MPLSDRRKLLAEGLIYKISTENNHPAYRNIMYLQILCNFSQYWAKKTKPIFIQAINKVNQLSPNLNDCPLKVGINDLDKPLELLELNLSCVAKLDDQSKTSNTLGLRNSFNKHINITYKDKIKIFTDGSKTSDGVGAAFWIPDLRIQQMFKLSKFSSSYTAELYAI